MEEELLKTVRYVADMLLYRVPPTKVEGEIIDIPCEGVDGVVEIWKGETTTYILGLMLGGALTMAGH